MNRTSPASAAPLIDRTDALVAIERALDASAPAQRWVLLEGPPGSGAIRLLDHAMELAAARGLPAARRSGGDLLEPPPADTASPQAVCVDDLQWLGADALRALRRPAGERAPAVVIGSVRHGVAPADPAGLAAIRTQEATAIVTLGPLDVTGIRRLLEAAGVADAPGLADGCLALSSGNPLLVSRLVRALQALEPGPDVLERAAAAVLPRLRRFCAAHVTRTVPGAEALIHAVNVLGDDTPLWLAAGIAGLSPDDAAAAADALVLSGLLETADPMRQRIPLAWRAMAEWTSGARRHQIHRAAARLLAQTDDGIEAAAAHLRASPPCGEPWAAGVLRDAAQLATADGRVDAAIERLERALAEPLPAAQRCALLEALGDARSRAGGDGAADAYRRALRVAEPEARPRLHLRLGRTLFGAGDYRASALELERGIDALDKPDDPLRVELVAAFVAAARFDRTLEGAAARHLAPFLDRSEPGRNPAERALLAEIALERGISGAPRDRVVALARRAWADGLLLEGADHHGIVLSQVAAVLTWSDEFAASDAVLTAALRHAEAASEPLLGATARYLRAWPRLYAGRLTEAEEDVRAALATPGWEMYLPSARAVLAHVLVERGDHEAARDALVLEDPQPWRRTIPYAMLLEARGRLHAIAGVLDAAADDLAEAGELMQAMGSKHPFCPWRSRLGCVRARQGDLAAASVLVDTELRQAEEIGLPRPLGVALRARADLQQRAGRDGEADLARAVEVLDGCGARIDHARALTDLGVALHDGGRHPEARRALRTALDAASALGAVTIAERAERELRRAGGRPGRRDPRTPAGLTASELHVARLAALGLTNAEIAAELVITTHTVRFHLRGVYRKLGVASRSELAGALGDAVRKP
ncbi:MAG: LuxR C-terminal-related transcriptional regulator [Solirubrobacteraceae bacterium]